MPEHDAIVIGSGQAGPPLAVRLAGAGMRVAVVERDRFGGTCVNTGCTPTKTMIASARAAHVARGAAAYGVSIEGRIAVDLGKVKQRSEAIVRSFREGVEATLARAGCTLYRGHARFVSANALDVAGTRLRSAKIFLDVGGRPRLPGAAGLERVPYRTSTTILELETLPPHLIVVGGSYVGLEFAQMFRRFGSRVTIVEMGARLVSREDEDVSQAILDILRAEGVEVHLGAECIELEQHGSAIRVRVSCKKPPAELEGSHVLIATGRVPNTDDLGLERAGVAVDAHGAILVDDELRTNVPGIWALGDCNGKGAFTHTAYNDFEIVAANLLDHGTRRVSDRIAAYALYIDPPLGRAGLTEAEVRKRGKPALVAKKAMSEVSRAIEMGETAGFMKIFVDAGDGEILGASILGVAGDEVIHSILDVMYARSPYTTIQRATHIHPTVAEFVPTLLEGLQPL